MKPFRNFSTGFYYIFRGFSYFFAKKRLWKHVIIPLLINILLLSVSLTILTVYIGDITEYFRNMFGLSYKDLADFAWYLKMLYALYNAMIWFVKLVVGILAFVVWGIILFVITQIVTSPFYDTLSEKVEKIERPDYVEIPFAQVFKLLPKILFTELCKMSILILIPLVLMLFNLIPGIGGFIYLALSFVFTSVIYASSFIDYPQARKNEGFGSRIGFARKNFFLLMGFGLPVFIPFVNIFITPFMVTAGTLLYLDKKK
jgi:CysZ protein